MLSVCFKKPFRFSPNGKTLRTVEEGEIVRLDESLADFVIDQGIAVLYSKPRAETKPAPENETKPATRKILRRKK